MSHFVGLCFGDNWEDNLDRYYEGLEVEAYVVYTKEEAIDHVKKTHANNYEFAVDSLQNPHLDSSLKERYQDIVDKGLFISYEDAWKEAKDWGYEIDENENLLSTYNPESKWDWCSVGGRWSGFLHYKDADPGFEETNIACIHELDMDYLLEHVPFCFITEDGEFTVIVKGDVDGSGEVDAADYLKVKGSLLGLLETAVCRLCQIFRS